MTVRKNDFINKLIKIILDEGDASWSSMATVRQIRWRLFITSFSILFFELLCIRWLPAYVRFLAYFMNFIMLASFLGIGLGIMISRREKLGLPNFSVWLFVIIIVTSLSQFQLYLPSTQVLYYAAGESVAPPENAIVLPVIFLLVAIAFMILSRPLGILLTALPPLQAYALDILGSLAGIAAFFIISYLSLPPFVWFLVLIGLILISIPKNKWINSAPFFIGSLIVVYLIGQGSLWSPYYRIQVYHLDSLGGSNSYLINANNIDHLNSKSSDGYLINVNNIGHQYATHYLNKETFYFRVYDLFGPDAFKKVLVLGAGSGSDIAIALNNGAEEVDAVEIDATIYRLGVILNPDHPYDDPRVKIHIDDGRSFLRNTTKKYDLIIFALPDSLTLTSSYSSLRLESFLLTTDAIDSARQHLSDDGMVVLYNYYRQDWLVQKLAGMVNHAFGVPPYVTTYGQYGRAAVIMDGPRMEKLNPALNIPYTENTQAVPAGRGMQLPVIGHGRMAGDPNQALAVDNWPFVYMPVPVIPTLYLNALGVVLLIALSLMAVAVPREIIWRFDWHFFFLGVAFMLLETRSLVTFGLLFGNTWMVNSLVFFAILSSVLLAILFNARFKLTRVWPLYIILFALLLFNYFLPLKMLLGISAPVLRYSLASILAFAPIFCANIVFSHSFRDSLTADIAFASNLLGAMIGGMLEYFALAFGYQALLLLVVLFYVIAYLTRKKLATAKI